MAVRRPHHGDIDSDTVEPDDPVRPRSLDGCLAFQLQTEIDEERDSSREVVDNDTDVVHPLDRHVLNRRDPAGSMVGDSSAGSSIERAEGFICTCGQRSSGPRRSTAIARNEPFGTGSAEHALKCRWAARSAGPASPEDVQMPRGVRNPGAWSVERSAGDLPASSRLTGAP